MSFANHAINKLYIKILKAMKCRYVIFIAAILALFSCEKEIDLRDLDDSAGSFAVSALAVPDSVFKLSITRSYKTDDTPVKVIKRFLLLHEGEYEYGNPDNGGEEWTYNQIFHKFDFDSTGRASEAYRKYAIAEAKVSAVVNGEERYEFSFNDYNCMYESEYIPKEGDEISLYAEGYADSTKSSYKKVNSKVVIPKKPKVEILDIEYEYRDFDYETNGMGHIIMLGEIDTVVRLKLKLHDVQNEQNYYRLKVRTYSWYHSDRGHHWDWTPGSGFFPNGDYVELPPSGPYVWHLNDIYQSDDILFRDERLVRGFSAWAPKFSNVFDDRQFKGGEYIVEVETRLCRGVDRKLRIELQTLTPDYYRYLKSFEVYRITSDDDFAENIYIHSNVNNGFGIVAGINSDVHMMDMKITSSQ